MDERPGSAVPEPRVFWPTLFLAVALALCKTAHVDGMDGAGVGEALRWATDLLIVAAADVAYAVGYGFAGWLALRAAAGRAAARALVWRAFLAGGAAIVFYGVVSVHVFSYLRSPLTFAWLYVAGDAENMRSSLAAFLTPGVVAELVAAPAAYLLVTMACLRRLPRAGPRGPRRVVAVSVLVLVPWNLGAHAAGDGEWGSRHDDRLLAQNPHLVLLGSSVKAMFGGGFVQLVEPYPPEDLTDFAPAGTRPWAAAPTPGLRRGPRNVILVVMESVGTQYVSLYGGRYPTMPRLEAEARHALVFDDVYAHITNTANSLAALTLSIYPPGLSYREVTRDTPRLAGTSLAQALSSRGYRTAFLSSGDNEYAGQGDFLAGRGFDAVRDWRDSGRERLFSWGVADEAMVDMTLSWIDAAPDRPFFAMTWTQGTHHPYEIPWEREKIDFFHGDVPVDDWDLGNFLNALRETDTQLGRLFDGLRARGLDRDTLVVVTGDHGEAFGSPHPDYGHCYRLFEEDVHVPFLVWSPALFDSPPRCRTVGGHVDVPPTVLDLLGVEVPGDWQGTSLLSPHHPGRAYFYGARDPYTLGVREGPFKYVLDVSWGGEELYDLPNDPTEQTNVHAAHPDVCARLRARLAAWFAYQNR